VLFAVLGATLIGAEWHAGTITTELTWEPRRARLHLAKVLAAAAFALVGFVALQVLVGLAVTPAAVLRGVTRGMDASWLWVAAGVLIGMYVGVLAAASLAAFQRRDVT